jgi:hypothetical protein
MVDIFGVLLSLPPFPMELLSKAELNTLHNTSEAPCVSLYLPTHVAGSEVRQDPIHLKNVLQDAEQQIQQHDLSSRDIADLLRPATDLLDNEQFWRYQGHGLALFLNPHGMKTYRLPLDFVPLAVVGKRFHLKPLMELFTGDRYFYLLALSQNQVRLFQATRYRISEIPLDDVPTSLDEALKYDDPEKQLQYHSGDTGSSPIYHGQGVGTTDNKDSIRRFFNKVDAGLHAYLNQETAPLVLVSVEYLQPIYQDVNSYPNLVHQGVYGNPDQMQPDELREAAWPCIEPLIDQAQQKALAQYAELHNTDKTGDRLEQIVPAAYNGQIDTLFVVKDAHHWGTYDPATSAVTLKKADSPEATDLLDLAAVHTLLQGGNVYLLPVSDMPESTSVAAIYRYEIPASLHR